MVRHAHASSSLRNTRNTTVRRPLSKAKLGSPKYVFNLCILEALFQRRSTHLGCAALQTDGLENCWIRRVAFLTPHGNSTSRPLWRNFSLQKRVQSCRSCFKHESLSIDKAEKSCTEMSHCWWPCCWTFCLFSYPGKLRHQAKRLSAHVGSRPGFRLRLARRFHVEVYHAPV